MDPSPPDRYELGAERHMREWRARERPDDEVPVAVPVGCVIGTGGRPG